MKNDTDRTDEKLVRMLKKFIKEQYASADLAMSSLHCGSENWEYRVAHRLHDFHTFIANTIERELGAGANAD